MILVPENEFSHLKGVAKQPYLDIRNAPKILLICNRFSEVLWCNRGVRMRSYFSEREVLPLAVNGHVCFEPFVMVWKNKGPNFSSNNPGEQEPLHHTWPVFHSSFYTPLCFLHPSNRPFLKHFASVSKQVWIQNHSYDFHLQIHFMIIKLSLSQRLVLKPRHEETFIHELLTGAFDWFLVLYWSLQGKLLNSEC